MENIAVITVHGVGDKQEFATVREIGDLLQDLNHDEPLEASFKKPVPCGAETGKTSARASPEKPRYFPFREQTLRINVRPVVVQPSAAPVPKSALSHGPFYSRVKNSKKLMSREEVWWDFTRGQLECYKGDEPEDTYKTLRLEGEKVDDSGQTISNVHLYELFWSDLSTHRAGVFSIFTEFYQLLFHLSSLGVHTITAATAVEGGRVWQARLKLQIWASYILTVAILILNLIMAGIAATGLGLDLLSDLTPRVQFLLVAAVPVAGILIGGGYMVWERGSITLWRWLLPWPPALAVGAILYTLSASYKQIGWALETAEGLVLASVAGLLIGLLLRAYDKRRPGALASSVPIAIFVIVAGLATLIYSGVSNQVAVCARLFEAALLSLAACWAAFIALTTVIYFAQARGADAPGRSTWSGVLMLALPAAVFILVSTVLWALIGEFLSTTLKDWPYVSIWGAGPKPLPLFLKTLLGSHVFPILSVAIILFAVAAFPAVWGVTPSVKTEIDPPEPFESIDLTYSQTLGTWLDSTFRGLTLSGFLLWLMVTAGMSLTVLLSYFHPVGSGNGWIAGGSLSVAAVITALFGARGSLQKLTLGFSPVLDVLLDVDNWLREMPRDSNPKARIMGRYVSLLRYVLNWKDPGGKPYHKIVILSHSQGSVLTADLLRYVAEEKSRAGSWADYDPQLARLDDKPLTLFTMGSPLRQLYHDRFPFLYDWAGRPDPTKLAGVKAWRNAYRSGDYVGRYLWFVLPGNPFIPAMAPLPHPLPLRSEFCVGAGAHTHYWDGTAPAVAHELDAMI